MKYCHMLEGEPCINKDENCLECPIIIKLEERRQKLIKEGIEYVPPTPDWIDIGV